MTSEADRQGRIVLDPAVHNGEACVGADPIPVRLIVTAVADSNLESVGVPGCPTINPDDIAAALRYAAEVASRAPAEALALARGPHRWWEPLIEFLIHVLLGSLIFVVIFMPAVGLNLLVAWLGTTSVGSLLIYVLLFAEYALVFIDGALYVAFLLNSAKRYLVKMWS